MSSMSKEWGRLIKAADYGGHSTVDTTNSNSSSGSSTNGSSDVKQNEQNDSVVTRRICKAIVEQDRLKHANEHGYSTLLMKMYPVSATPKNDIIIGWHNSSENAFSNVDSEAFGLVPVQGPIQSYLK